MFFFARAYLSAVILTNPTGVAPSTFVRSVWLPACGCLLEFFLAGPAGAWASKKTYRISISGHRDRDRILSLNFSGRKSDSMNLSSFFLGGFSAFTAPYFFLTDWKNFKVCHTTGRHTHRSMVLCSCWGRLDLSFPIRALRKVRGHWSSFLERGRCQTTKKNICFDGTQPKISGSLLQNQSYCIYLVPCI